jgi:hypothetical protein
MTDVLSSLNAINSLAGGYARGIPIGIESEPQGGKSTFLSQEAFFFAKQFGTIHIDTEGAVFKMYQLWKEVFERRFNVKVSLIELSVDVKSKTFKPKLEPEKWDEDSIPIIIANLRSVHRLLQFFGIESKVEPSPKGKYGFRFLGECGWDTSKVDDKKKAVIKKESFIRYLLNEYDIQCVILDSVTTPMNIFVGGLVNYPARGDAEKVLFRYCQMLSDDYMPLLLMTHHISKDPQNQWAEPNVVGGKNIRHNTKISFYMEKSRSTNKKYKNRRWLYLDRWFNKPRFSEKRKVELTDNGFIDLEDQTEEKDEEENENEQG